MTGPDVHYTRTVLARFTFCGWYVPAVKVTSVRGDVTCDRCRREFSGTNGGDRW